MDSVDEGKRRQERERGSKARLIIDSPLWEEAWTELQTRLTEAWLRSQTGDAQRRELIYMQLRAAAEVRGHIETVLETGRLAEMQLDEHERERHRSAD